MGKWKIFIAGKFNKLTRTQYKELQLQNFHKFIKSFAQPFDTHCCHMGTAIKRPVPDQVKPSFVIFDIRAL